MSLRRLAMTSMLGLCSLTVWAETNAAEGSAAVVGVLVDWRGRERVNGLDYDWAPAWGVVAGLRRRALSLSLEGQQWCQKTSAGSLVVASETRQMIAWIGWATPGTQDWSGEVRVGSGGRWSKVRSRLGETEDVASGGPAFVLGIGGVLSWRLVTDWQMRLALGAVEIESVPAPEWSAGLGLTYFTIF